MQALDTSNERFREEDYPRLIAKKTSELVETSLIYLERGSRRRRFRARLANFAAVGLGQA